MTVFEAMEWVQAGWGDWLGLTDTTGRFRRGQFPTSGELAGGSAAMGWLQWQLAQAPRPAGVTAEGSCEWGGWEAEESCLVE